MHKDDHASADVGLTHLALPVHNLDTTASFYATYALLEIVHDRRDDGVRIAWLSDGSHPFVLVCIETTEPFTPLEGVIPHIGVGVETRAELDERVELARRNGVTVDGPYDEGPPVGYWAILRDPDGHQLELSVGQEIAATVAQAGQ